MKIKKLFCASVLTGAALVGLASCGGNADDDKTVTFYTTAGDLPMQTINVAKEKFEKENEGWKVNVVNGFSYDSLRDKVTSMISSNTQPSVAYCYPDHVASYLRSGKVLDLTKFKDNEEYGFTKEEWADFVPSYMTEGVSYSQEGMFSIPFVRSTEVLYYNKTVLDKHSIAVPKTWAQLWDACATLKGLYKNSKPLAYDSEANWAITYLEQYAKNEGKGGKYYTNGSLDKEQRITFNNDILKNFFKEAKSKYDTGLFTSKGVNGGSYGSTLIKQYDKETYKDSSSYGNFKGSFFSIGSTGGAAKQNPEKKADGSMPFEAEVAGLPGITEASALTISQGPSLVMFDQGNDERAIATWKFVKTLLDPAIQAQYAIENGYNPVRQSVYELDVFKAAMDEEADSLVSKSILLANELGQKDLFFTSDAFVGSAKARDQIGQAMINVMKASKNDDATIQGEIDEAYEEAVYYTKKG